MPKYEILPTTSFSVSPVMQPMDLPEVVHMEDPALMVMIDFKLSKPPLIDPNTSIDDALDEMKISEVHQLLVADEDNNIIGIVGSEDIVGEKPIKLIQERRINRGEIMVKMIMTRAEEILAFNIEDLKHARVGNVVNTLKERRQHYALVIKIDDQGKFLVRGLFSTSQISKQLHMNIANGISGAATIAELQKRHT